MCWTYYTIQWIKALLGEAVEYTDYIPRDTKCPDYDMKQSDCEPPPVMLGLGWFSLFYFYGISAIVAFLMTNPFDPYTLNM